MNPERRYRESVNRYLPRDVYHQGMGGVATNGTPDSYYEGSFNSLWVEWKWTNSKNPVLIPEPSALQKRWLTRAYSNGVNVAVICGCPLRGYVFPGFSWELRHTTGARLVGDRKAIAAWITSQVIEDG